MNRSFSIFFCILILIVFSCKNDEPYLSASHSIFNNVTTYSVYQVSQYDWDLAKTSGNSTWLPVYRSGYPSEYVGQIHEVLDAFSKDFPDRLLVSVSYEVHYSLLSGEKNADTKVIQAYFSGMWLTHVDKNSFSPVYIINEEISQHGGSNKKRK